MRSGHKKETKLIQLSANSSNQWQSYCKKHWDGILNHEYALQGDKDLVNIHNIIDLIKNILKIGLL